jgi:PAS domain S-box-containing protein
VTGDGHGGGGGLRDADLAVLDTLFAQAPIGLAFIDRELRYTRVNDALAEINGIPAEEHLGRTVPEILPGMDPGVVEAFRRVLATGAPVVDQEVEAETPAAPGYRRAWLASYYPVYSRGGEVIGVGVVVVETTLRKRAEEERARALELEHAARAEAEEAERRARFLAEASVILDQSLDYDATLTNLSRLAVPWLADWFAVDVVEPDASLRRVTVAHVDPEKARLAQELAERYPTDPDSPTGIPAVVRSGRPELYAEIREELVAEGARDREHLELLRALELKSAMLVPMTARGRTLGAITLASSAAGRHYDEDDLMLAQEVARRAAIAVNNARLYEERARTARTLQESLLPPRLPDVPGIDVGARYRAAGEGNEVGGDFYDVFAVPAGGWGVVIGDVCGKGAEAAALTALVRYTLRALASATTPPSAILAELNRSIRRQRSDNRFCTVTYAHLTPVPTGARVTLAAGGHPLPAVLRAGGQVEYVGCPGTLLGVLQDPRLRDSSVELGPGDSLVLYTDGVTDAGAPEHLVEPDELAAKLAKCRRDAASEVARCLEEAVVTDGFEPHDDIAILVVRVPTLERAGLGTVEASGAPA